MVGRSQVETMEEEKDVACVRQGGTEQPGWNHCEKGNYHLGNTFIRKLMMS